MDTQQVLALVVVVLTVILMTRSRVRKRRLPPSGCGGSCNCTSAQKTIRYNAQGEYPSHE